MEHDIHLTPDQAIELHQRETNNGFLVMWTVTWNTSDYPWQAAARPILVGVGTSTTQPLRSVLLAHSVDAVRDQLPPGLSRLERDAADDPVILEVWL
jgi:hypothetical protein